jgi:hypothetical protein
MNTYHRRLFLAIAALAGCAAFAQQAGTASILPDDPEVYFGFFSFRQAMQKQIVAAKDASDGAALQQAAAQNFGISASDFAIVGLVSSSTLGGISALAQEARTYIAQELAAGQTPDPGTLAAFSAGRLALLRQGAANLQSSMSPAGLVALHSYINDRYRPRIVQMESTHAH